METKVPSQGPRGSVLRKCCKTGCNPEGPNGADITVFNWDKSGLKGTNFVISGSGYFPNNQSHKISHIFKEFVFKRIEKRKEEVPLCLNASSCEVMTPSFFSFSFRVSCSFFA